ncbi:MAG: DsrE family protein [Deltaproteobacteria bacterium]|jgi:hypothetical protein|nr:DsrE family protein [Deltaproteobacteria bacterium]MBT4527862.1 DsrE family protein [Deltaproteobacteria bacterium]
MDKLIVIWSSADREVALKMAFMYTLNAKAQDWWKEVTLIIWGPSAKLLAQDDELQAEIKKMKNAGVKIMACKSCSDSYQVSENLNRVGVQVQYMGLPLTQYLKSDNKVLTF